MHDKLCLKRHNFLIYNLKQRREVRTHLETKCVMQDVDGHQFSAGKTSYILQLVYEVKQRTAL